jgi:small subunit ribosomal protein S20
MPNIKSAKKRAELSSKARLKNRSERSRLRTAIKSVHDAPSADEARTRLGRTVALLDRAATRNLVHPNRVARLKGQLQRHVNALAS